MADYLSPGVYVRERVADTTVESQSTNITVNVGRFDRGPVNARVFNTEPRQYRTTWGNPTDDNYKHFFSGWNFLQYGNKLYQTRVVNEDGIQTSIDGAVGVGDTVIPVADTSDYPNEGQLSLINDNNDREVVSYNGKSLTTFNNVSRGIAGSVPSSYTGGETVALVASNSSLAISNTASPFETGLAATGSLTFVEPQLLTNEDNFTISDGSRTVTMAINKARNGSTFTVDDTTDILTINASLGMVTGDQVNLTSAGTLPAGFNDTTNYYVNSLSSTTVTLHLTLTDAINGSNIVDATDTGTGVHTLTEARGTGTFINNAVPVDISADSLSNSIDDIGTPVDLIFNNMYVVEVVTGTPFRTAPFSSTSGILGTYTSSVDADTHFTGSVIRTNAGGNKGIVRHKVGNTLYVQMITGSFSTGDGVDNADTWISDKTKVKNFTRLLTISSTYSDPTVTLVNDNSDDRSTFGNIPISVTEASPNTITPVGMSGAKEPRSYREDYVTRYNINEDPINEITFTDNEIVKIYAKNPGEWGQNISVSLASPWDFDSAVVLSQGNSVLTFPAAFTSKPLESKRQFALAVIETDEVGNKDLVETFIVSLNSNEKDGNGNNNFAENVLLGQSSYIFCEVNPVSNGTEGIQTNLTASITASDVTIPVSSTSGYPTSGRVLIENELIEYTGITLTTFTGAVRGVAGTDALAHADTTNVFEQNTVGLVSEAYLIGGHDAIIDAESIQDEIIAGYSLYANKEDITVDIVIDGGNHDSVIIQQHIIDNVIGRRRDCMAILTPPEYTRNLPDDNARISAIIDYRINSLNRYERRGALYGNFKYQYDAFADKERWLPLSGDIAGVYARTDVDFDPWFPPAGAERGVIKNAIKFAIAPTLGNRDLMYVDDINPVYSKTGVGPVVWGQKTLEGSGSSFSRVNVVRLFNYAERGSAQASIPFVFEFNDQPTRNRLLNLLNPFFRDIRSRRGVTDFYLVCDDTNNTSAVINRFELHCDIYLKPNKGAEAIQLTFINTPEGVSFQEIAKQN